MQSLLVRIWSSLQLRSTAIIAASLLLTGIAPPSLAKVSPYVTTGKPAAAYLPANTQYNPEIPTPEDFLGFQVGEWHIRHDQLVAYMYALAEASDRVTIEEIGRTHQHNPLVHLTITATDNFAELDTIRQNHLDDIAKQRTPAKDAPIIINMGYGIHGNEPSASNAAVIVAYYLAAGESERINAILDHAIVLLDPSLNPDGMSRFALWANMHRGQQLNASPFHREHVEPWPNGRTNYYWFDLNRDWLLLTHPESKARVEQFQKWRPHVLTDFHEMGTDSTYFFQPGVRSRKNPLTPEGNVTLTHAIAKFHAKALDNAQQLYFTEESFDDFYFGKGSTYPDAHGSIGILFEQASSRGHIQSSINGDVRFDRAIENQVITSLSTFDGAIANKAALLDYQVTFARQTDNQIKQDDTAGMLLKQPRDSYRFGVMLDKLDAHNIVYSVVTANARIKEFSVEAAKAVFVPYNQPQYRLVKSLFSERTSFPDNTFYDVSNWNMPLAFDIEYTGVTARQARQLDLDAGRQSLHTDSPAVSGQPTVAFGFDWHHYQAPALTQKLLQHGVTLRVAGKGFTANVGNKEREFKAGAVVIPTAFNAKHLAHVAAIAEEFAIPLWPINSGLTSQGIDLGSRNMQPVSLPKVLLVGGKGTTDYEVGEIWHYFDTRVGAPVTIVEQTDLSYVELDQFTHIIFANGRYNGMSQSANKRLGEWLNSGGTLIGQKSALRYFKQQKWLDISIIEQSQIDRAFNETGLRYEDKEALAAKKRISGSAFMTRVDTSHPLFFGVDNDAMAMFKTANLIVEHTGSPFETVAVYDDEPLAGGYAANELVKKIGRSAAVVTQSKGQGRVIGFVDNVNFRGYWYGTSKLMSNAVFLSGLIE